MNRIKRSCALLLAIVLVLGVAIQPGIGGVFAGQADPYPEITESVPEETTPETTAPEPETTTPETTAPEATTPKTTAPEPETTETPETTAPEPTVEPETTETPETTAPETTAPEPTAWAALTDAELAAWLMDEANADAVKAILTDETTAEYAELTMRIDAILDGEDTVLAEQLMAYLTALVETDGADSLADKPDEYIYFDLAAGNVNIGSTTYSGSIYVGGTVTSVTGSRADGDKFYIYQSNLTEEASVGYYKNTGYATTPDYEKKQNCRVPAYGRVVYEGKGWTEYITNNINVEAVSRAWPTAAGGSKREATDHYITFLSESDYTADVTIDNIWSKHHPDSVDRTTGGIGANLRNGYVFCMNTHIRIRLKGDSRVGCVHYCAREDAECTIEFYDGETSGTPDTPAGSITVADFPDNLDANHWNAAIGGSDNPQFCGDKADGIVIHGGVIYAGTTKDDNCTAIGGGGNDYGGVTINGGTVTAVVSSTGTAIGGGIGYSAKGGDTDVLITGGIIYAYNFGIAKDAWDKFNDFVPAAAIGGGGSIDSAGGLTANITITGGTIYAQSMGGPAIGGGGSNGALGGPANITITGGNITAKSIPGKFGDVDISEGVSIGGGTGKTGGGSVTLLINEDVAKNKGEKTIIRTGSIGGGNTTGSGTIGSAQVTIEGGDITGQVIMEGKATAEGQAATAGTGDSTDNCSFTMIGGIIHDTDVTKDGEFFFLREDGGAVWMQDPRGVTDISGGIIEGCKADRGGAVYMEGGTFTLSGTGTIRENEALRGESGGLTGYGGGVYVTGGTAKVTGGTISGNKAQIRGGGLYVTGEDDKIGTVNVSDGTISGNIAGFGESLPVDAGSGGGVYLEGGRFEMIGGKISGNSANYRGGGIFLTVSPTLNGGEISGNTAKDSGGGLCVNGAGVELTKPEMRIFGNNAKNGGGVAVLNGSFTLNGGAVGVENGNPNVATEKGGGVYVQAENTGSTANATVSSGNVWYNKANEGGGIYLASGNFTLQGEHAVVSHNTAANGGGVYLYTDPALHQGRIELNTATVNGGGMYIEDCLVTLNPTGRVFITENKAKNGAGIYIHGNPKPDNPAPTPAPDPATQVDGISSGTMKPDAIGLLVGAETTGHLFLTDNTADTGNGAGGAVCIAAADEKSRFELDTDHITVTGNQAANGGGVAVLHGNFTMTAGSIGPDSIGQNGGANTATNGGGVYVSDGEIWLKGGTVEGNEATDGGGAYVTGGNFTMINGALVNNTARENGGGGYVAGNFKMLDGTIGGSAGGNHAENGGGIYVNDGNVTIVCGHISHNHAEKDGGGFFVSATAAAAAEHEAVRVVMLSGSLSHNEAKVNGGGMAVESANNQKIAVEIGCLLNHNVKDGSPTFPIDYEGDVYGSYKEFGGTTYRHDSCPVVEYNQAGEIGGGFFMNSEDSTLSFFCVKETRNTAKGDNTAGMDVVGGKVIIGDSEYHNVENTKHQHIVPWGYISMDDATLVNGGQVDIYGDMNNPIFRDEVTVDIKDASDHFMDHRRAHDAYKSYKVHYIENFFGTGLYQAVQYDEGNTNITIEDALYSRPGYRILGWCTQPKRDPTAKDNYYYEVGTKLDLASGNVPGMGVHSIQCDICGENTADSNLLELYAIWKANGYTVVFDPNVQQGDTYTGTMEDQVFQYAVERTLTKNDYKYPGYFFKEWNTKADGTGTSYADEYVAGKKDDPKTNLTDKNGVKIVLYAQWEPCDHTDPARWTYDVKPEAPETLWRICSCGKQTLTATLHAENAVYDGKAHTATLTLNDEAAWGTDKPTIKYEGAWLVDGLTHPVSMKFTADGKPFHAGEYKATITKPDGDGTEKEMASVTYTIEKADQKPPEKPTYTVTNDGKLTIKRVKNDPNRLEDNGNHSYDAKVQYRLSYYSGSGLVATTWQMIPDGADLLDITMETAWTSYYVEARYEELVDYKASEIVRADAVYHFAGDVEVKIICDEGIDAHFKPTLNEKKELDGATLTVTTQTGYYTVGGKYEVSATILKKDSPTSSSFPIDEGMGADDHQYSVKNVPTNSILTITIGKARKIPTATEQVTPRQIFSSFTGTAATISRDSAFTAAFQIKNFDPCYTSESNIEYGVYDGLKLTFSSAVPKDTTIILLDRRDSSYWYYRAEAEAGVSSVPLTAFRKMGGEENEYYAIPHPEPPVAPDTVNGYIDLSYQFIVDFSQSEGYTGAEDKLTMTLEATIKNVETTKAPELKPGVEVTMVTPSFSLASTGDGSASLTQGLKGTYGISESVSIWAASKWENRASALILTPTGATGDSLPPDARIKAEVDGGTTYLYQSGGAFIVPLSLLQTGEKDVKLTLLSDLFPMVETSYPFDARWLISQSKAGKAPENGDNPAAGVDPAAAVTVTFTSTEKKIPSLKVVGAEPGKDRVLAGGDTLKLKIETLHMDGYTVSAALLRKTEDGSYTETGWVKEAVSIGSGSLDVPLTDQGGSYCLRFTVQQENSVISIMEVPYFFVVKPTQ